MGASLLANGKTTTAQAEARSGFQTIKFSTGISRTINGTGLESGILKTRASTLETGLQTNGLVRAPYTVKMEPGILVNSKTTNAMGLGSCTIQMAANMRDHGLMICAMGSDCSFTPNAIFMRAIGQKTNGQALESIAMPRASVIKAIGKMASIMAMGC
jgi:hypothetical protein